MKHLLSTIVAAITCVLAGHAQSQNLLHAPLTTSSTKSEIAKPGIFNHLDIGLSAASTGLGFDVKAPIGPYVNVRTGFSFMPGFRFRSDYKVLVGGEVEKRYDDDGNLIVDSDGSPIETKFDKMSGLLNDLTGFQVDEKVGMIKKFTMWNYKLLVDVHPIRNYRNFYFTLGFYAGPSRVAKAYNITEDAPSLVAVGMYNSLYRKACLEEDIVIGNFSLPDIEIGGRTLYGELTSYGMAGATLGRFPDGDRAVVVPDANGMIKSRMKARAFRPYMGLGWDYDFKRNSRYHLSIDAGCFFWGGSPRIYVDNVYKVNFKENGYDMVAWQWNNSTTGETITTAPYAARPRVGDSNVTSTEGRFMRTTDADGNTICAEVEPQTIDMVRDIRVTHREVGDLVKLAKKLKVYPTISITFSRTIF